MRIPLSDWLPDLPPLGNDGSDNIKNAIPGAIGYRPFKSLVALSANTLDGAARGAISAVDSASDTHTFAGTLDKLYSYLAGTFSDVSVSGGYHLSAEERWEFVQFGQRIIATAITDPVQTFVMGSDSLFSNLPGSPPQARHIAIVRDFVVLANTSNSPDEVYWSGFNDSEGWDIGTNQCDSQQLLEDGFIQAITGGEVGYIFQDRAITRMTYVGPPLIFQFDKIEVLHGVASPASVVRVGNIVYALGNDGFFSFDGTQSTPISAEKLDRWFLDNFAPSTYAFVTAGADPVHKLIYWGFVSNDSPDPTMPDTVLIYNTVANKFTYAKVNHEIIYPALSEATSIEQVGALYATLEDVPVSLDSRAFAGGAFQLNGFDDTHSLGTFDGPALEATLESTVFEPNEGMRSVINNTRPLTDSANATVTINAYDRLANAPTQTATAAMEVNGDCPILASGRYFSMTMDIPAADAWTFAQGFDVDVDSDGER